MAGEQNRNAFQGNDSQNEFEYARLDLFRSAHRIDGSRDPEECLEDTCRRRFVARCTLPGTVPFFVGAGDGQQHIVNFISIDIHKYGAAHADAVAMREKLPRHGEPVHERPLETPQIRNQRMFLFVRDHAMPSRNGRIFFQTDQAVRCSANGEIAATEIKLRFLQRATKRNDPWLHTTTDTLTNFSAGTRIPTSQI